MARIIPNSDKYFVNAETNQTTFTIVDIPEQTPAPAEETGPNDTISQAVNLNLNPQNTSARVKGNLFPREDGVERADYRDFSEDVDFYRLELSAGDTVKIDIDSIPFETARFPEVEQRLDSELHLFDASGNEIVRVNNAAAPDEQLHRDPYLEFTAEETGNYYLGISQLGNRNYDPNVERSGSGWIFPEIGVFSGEYELNVELTPGKSELIESAFENIFGTIDGDVIEVEGTNKLIFGGDSDDLIDASITSGDWALVIGNW